MPASGAGAVSGVHVGGQHTARDSRLVSMRMLVVRAHGRVCVNCKGMLSVPRACSAYQFCVPPQNQPHMCPTIDACQAYFHQCFFGFELKELLTLC